MIRVGFGYDVHQLCPGLALWLGGIQIPYPKGLLGHSDADVLIHALCDALLGAACLQDIGYHFPDTDERYHNVDSKILLQETLILVKEKGYSFVNADMTVCAQKPKLFPFIPRMRQTIAKILGVDVDFISIKATTTEHLGFEGREEGISASAVVLIEK